MIICRSVLLRMTNVSRINCRENPKTHIVLYNFFLKAFRLWDNVAKYIVEPGRPQMTVWRRRIECRIPKATNTLSDYVIFIAFPRQPWLHERVSLLLYTYIACPLVVYLHLKVGSTIGLFLSAFRTTILRAFLIFPMRATCPVYLSLVHSISLVIYYERYEHCCSLFCTNSAAPHYVRTLLLLIVYEQCCSSLCTKSAAPHYVISFPTLAAVSLRQV